MADSTDRIGRVLRFVTSGGMAAEDPDIIAALLTQAHHMAELVIADSNSSADLRRLATDFLERLDSDTFDPH